MNRLAAKFVHGISRLAFWRRPAAPLLEQPGAEASTEQPAETEGELAASADASGPPGDRFERARVLATLSSKRVWIPGAAGMLLGLAGVAMALMPPQVQEKERLQTERPATQGKREQTAVVKKTATVADAPAAAAEVPAWATSGRAVTDSRAGLDDADCQVSDKASVTRNLKNCIDSFNQSRSGRADRSTRTPVANGPREI